MKLPWLEPDTPLPPAASALREPDGLLAAGADLSVARLHEAYSHGIFPWFSEGEPVLWWSPDPRMVLACADFSESHSLAKRLRRMAREEGDRADGKSLLTETIEVRVDTAFEQVLLACAAPRGQQNATWITPAMRQVYLEWHHAGAAHSIETWIDGHLSAGLYGISLGGMFFGESMFTRVTDGSKIALAHLVRFLKRHDVPWIDCQQQTRHLGSLGAKPVPRERFVDEVQQLVRRASPPWQPGRLDTAGVIHPLGPPAFLPADDPV
ncbi:leucyl/phenylalanyl-tRNA--protein transferase [Bordetella sp. N]|uniref:leucyl/phenylalanyl-tRNA--protein transferase n=1 Tax=Bordetella sp. N TaxID=1746199 RepID=UPI00070E52D4|nr:leucyl/phenylalanyl-tRNA--protein transferase [Bordetella sp. N]ALM84623.1 leucyl/phenylalanyl-tRNA--protein transferase [Bordetella sp. N]